MAKQKLKEAERITIKELHQQGISLTALAERFDVSYNTIKRICHPERYKQQLEINRQYQNRNRQQIYETRKANSKRYKIEFNKEKDAEIISHLEKQGNVQDYIRQLIYKDIKRN